MSKVQYQQLAKSKARKYGIDPDLFVKQIDAESGFNPNSGSSAGAIGIAQIMPATAKAWGVNPRNVNQSLDAAAKHMAQYIKKYGNWEKALRAYNAGEGAIEKSKGYSETNNYVNKILGGMGTSAGGSVKVDDGGIDIPVIGDAMKGINAVGNFFAALFDPTFWLRVGKVLAGAMLLFLAVSKFSSL